MGLFDIFSNKPTPSKIAKITKKILNEYQQQQIRQEGLEELVNFGTPEAIEALVKRLGVNFRDTIKNEQEKTWVTKVLVERFGDDAIEPLRQYIRSEQSISAAIMALGQIIADDAIVTFLIETLAQYDASDHRSISARLQLIDALSDYQQDGIVDACLPYLLDHDDDIRVKVMELVGDRVSKDHPSIDDTVGGLIDVLADPLASGRVTRKAATVLQQLDIDLSKRADSLADNVPDGFTLGSNGRLQSA